MASFGMMGKAKVAPALVKRPWGLDHAGSYWTPAAFRWSWLPNGCRFCGCQIYVPSE